MASKKDSDEIIARIEQRLRLFAAAPHRDTAEGEAYLQDVGHLLERLKEIERVASQSKKKVEKITVAHAAAMLRAESWRGEVRNLLHDRPRALGRHSHEVIAELVAEMESRRQKKRELRSGEK
jgi:hypothetical protein